MAVKGKQKKDGKIMGWFVWKVDPKSNENKPWADYLILNIYANKQQMDDMNSKSVEWWENEIKMAHKGKTKAPSSICFLNLGSELIFIILSDHSLTVAAEADLGNA